MYLWYRKQNATFLFRSASKVRRLRCTGSSGKTYWPGDQQYMHTYRLSSPYSHKDTYMQTTYACMSPWAKGDFRHYFSFLQSEKRVIHRVYLPRQLFAAMCHDRLSSLWATKFSIQCILKYSATVATGDSGLAKTMHFAILSPRHQPISRGWGYLQGKGKRIFAKVLALCDRFALVGFTATWSCAVVKDIKSEIICNAVKRTTGCFSYISYSPQIWYI